MGMTKRDCFWNISYNSSKFVNYGNHINTHQQYLCLRIPVIRIIRVDCFRQRCATN